MPTASKTKNFSLFFDVNSTGSEANVTDLEEAEMEIIKHVQRKEFPSETPKFPRHPGESLLQ